MNMTDIEVKDSVATYDLASPLNRLAALAIDLSVCWAITVLPEWIALVARTFNIDWLLMSLSRSSLLTFYGLATAYILCCDAFPHGQSVGKRFLNISVVGFPFEVRCTLLQSIVRNAPKLLLSVLDGIFVFFGFRRRLGDMLASTIVVNTSPRSA